MAKQVPTRFTEWEFTTKEAYVATRFTELNLMLIQTLIAQAAVRRTNLHYDPKEPEKFMQQEAEITGEIGAYEHLLTLFSDSVAPVADKQDEKADISKTPATPTS